MSPFFKTNWSYSGPIWMRIIAPWLVSIAPQVPERSSWKAPALSRETSPQWVVTVSFLLSRSWTQASQHQTVSPDAEAKTLGCTSQEILTDGNQLKKSLQKLGETWKTCPLCLEKLGQVGWHCKLGECKLKCCELKLSLLGQKILKYGVPWRISFLLVP